MASDFRATYRLMLRPGFGFAEARALVPYLRDLGISHLYLSPSFQARPGSEHGYDVIDPTRISDELGGEDEFRALCSAGLGVILDVVPNHMAVDDANRYWTEEREKFFDVDPQTGRHRRFFDIDHLAGVRQESPAVFSETHRLALSLVHEGLVDGLRIDHPDGLADPAGYLERLAGEGVEHVWVEKILDPGEQLPDWPVEGTVGYEFLNDVAALFVDPAAEPLFDELWGDPTPFGEAAQQAKREQARGPFAPDVAWLTRLQHPVPDPQRCMEALCSLPVYRTYIREGRASEQDLRVLRESGLEWLLDQPDEFVTRFQQTTPPIMAKGVEDTAFYRHARFVALNDVGGDPSRFGISVEEFHRANLIRQERFARNLLITTTHDTKRTGDVRARLTALSEMPERWRQAVSGVGELTPERYFLLQNIVGAWPITPERLDGYVEKAMREAKTRSNWIDPDLDFERETKEWARQIDPSALAADLDPVADRHLLAQLLLKLTVPGVPDIYNGDEVGFRALVDPDNRRPIDWERVRRGDAKSQLIRAVLAAGIEGEYEPLPAPAEVCAFRRGRFHVEVAIREGARISPPAGDPVWAGPHMGIWRLPTLNPPQKRARPLS